MDKEFFEDLLDAHDWYYSYSECVDTFRSGQHEKRVILDIMRNNDELQELYYNYLRKLKQ